MKKFSVIGYRKNKFLIRWASDKNIYLLNYEGEWVDYPHLERDENGRPKNRNIPDNCFFPNSTIARAFGNLVAKLKQG